MHSGKECAWIKATTCDDQFPVVFVDYVSHVDTRQFTITGRQDCRQHPLRASVSGAPTAAEAEIVVIV